MDMSGGSDGKLRRWGQGETPGDRWLMGRARPGAKAAPSSAAIQADVLECAEHWVILDDRNVKCRLIQWLFPLALGLAVALPASAQSLQEAARQAARQHNAKVLSARTINKGKQPVHEIKLLTEKGVVKTVRIPDRRSRKNPR
jgi:hypothetical protein